MREQRRYKLNKSLNAKALAILHEEKQRRLQARSGDTMGAGQTVPYYKPEEAYKPIRRNKSK